jgi:hypothetical protein
MYTLPPDLQSFHEAPPEEYRERSSGEIIVNPDFTTMWEVNEGHPDFKANK